MKLSGLLYGSGLMLINIFSSAQETKLPEQQDRWKIQPDGSIEWRIAKRIPHSDHIEMAGEKVALWMQYGVDSSGRSKLSRTVVFPTFRLLPQRTIAHMTYNVEDVELSRIYINDRLLKGRVHNAEVAGDLQEKMQCVTHKGIMQIESMLRDTVLLRRTFFPSVDKPVAIEKPVFINNGKRPVIVDMDYMRREVRPAAGLSNTPDKFQGRSFKNILTEEKVEG